MFPIANRYGYGFDREQTIWHIESGTSIYRICGWSVPISVLKGLNLNPYQDAYLTSNGYWFREFDRAVLNLDREPASELLVKGNCLSFFLHQNWAIEAGNPDSRYTYRVFRSGSIWDAEII